MYVFTVHLSLENTEINFFPACIKYGFSQKHSLHLYVFAIFICFYAKKHSFRYFAITYVELRKKTARISELAVIAWKGNPTKVFSAYSTPISTGIHY